MNNNTMKERLKNEKMFYVGTRFDNNDLFDAMIYGLAPLKNKLKSIPDIEKVIFNDPATIVIWSNGDKTVVRCQPGDTFDKEKGIALAVTKYVFGNKSKYNEIIKKFANLEA